MKFWQSLIGSAGVRIASLINKVPGRPAPPPGSAVPGRHARPELDWIATLSAQALGAPAALLLSEVQGEGAPRVIGSHGLSGTSIRTALPSLPEWLFHSAGRLSREIAQGPLRGGSYVLVPIGRPGSNLRAVLCVIDRTARPGGVSATEKECLNLLARIAWQQLSSGTETRLDFAGFLHVTDDGSIIRRAAIEQLQALFLTRPATEPLQAA